MDREDLKRVNLKDPKFDEFKRWGGKIESQTHLVDLMVWLYYDELRHPTPEPPHPIILLGHPELREEFNKALESHERKMIRHRLARRRRRQKWEKDGRTGVGRDDKARPEASKKN